MGRRVLVLGTTLAVVLALVGFRLVTARRFRQGMSDAVRDFERGQYATALRILRRVDGLRPGQGEVAYRIGLCEQALGHHAEALRAWEHVPPEGEFGYEAALARGTLLVNTLRFRPAEDVLEATLKRSPREDVRRALTRLYRFEGRIDDVRRLLQETCESVSDPTPLLADLWLLDTAPWPIAAIETMLTKAGADDDRVWLGRANLALMTGRFEDARHALDVCLQSQPDEPVIWSSRLELARNTNDLDGVREALRHLPANRFTPEDELTFRVWWAARQHDPTSERRAIEKRLAQRPSDTRALERLAELALEVGDIKCASECRARKLELDDDKERYRTLLNEPEPNRQARQLSALAERLGRDFEARAWGALALQQRPDDSEVRARLDRLRPARAPFAAATLAERFADLLRTEPQRVRSSMSEARPVVPRFTDDAEKAGLRFFQDNGATSSYDLPEIMAGGVAVLDYDGDGWLDVYAVQGGPFPPDPANSSTGDRLFRNRGHGQFEDVTEPSGIGRMARGYGHGVAVGDFDNDGRPDLFITRWRGYALHRNRGDGRFDDVTAAAGLGGERDWPTSAAWADLDNDGDLDLYVCHYLRFDPRSAPVCTSSVKPNARIYCDPMRFEACADHVFRNDDGRFVDVTATAGILDRNGRGLGVLAADFDDDGWVDLFVTNDMTANYFFRNRGGFRFEEVAHEVGVASNADGGYHAGMGIACGDLDGDGRLDLFVTNSYNEATTFYRNFGQGVFVDWTAVSGLAVATRYLVGFGVATLDYDNDGRLDLISANGNLNDARPYNPFPMPVQLLAGRPGGRLSDVSGPAGSPWSTLRMGRGLAVGDLDNDGRTDALVMSLNEPLAFLHNGTGAGRSVTLRLEGRRSNRDAVGARVTLRAGGRQQVAQRFGGGSYQSASDPRLYFGLGDATRVEFIEVHWPAGGVDRYSDLASGNEYLLREGEAAPVSARPTRP